MKQDNDTDPWGNRHEGFRLSSGRFINPNGLIVGINPKLEVFEGYDSRLYELEQSDEDVMPDEIGYEPGWTPEECAELADFMIELWRQFREKHAPTQLVPTATDLLERFKSISDLCDIPAAVIAGWTTEEREEADDWSGYWDIWTSDVARGPLPTVPNVLKPYVEPPYGTKKR
jgi:hypothetical protein